MKKFLLGAFVGLLFAFVCIVVLVAVALKIGATKTPVVASNSALILNLEGDLPEVPQLDIDIPLVPNQSVPTIRDIWAALKSAANDARIKAIVLKPRGLSAGWGKLSELRAELAQFRRSGKPIYAYLQTPGMHEYYLASVADKIYLSPDDYIELKGFRVEAMYLKGSLDKLGIRFDIDHMGRYKDAGDVFTRTNMSSETREVFNDILDQIYGSFCGDVGAGRRKSVDDVKLLIDQGPALASTAKQSGLIDEVGYESQLIRDLTYKLKLSSLPKTPYRSYVRAAAGVGERIAFLAGEGEIIRGSVDHPFAQAQVIASETFGKTIEQVRRDKSIKGVILRVDSPGGDAVASDEILHELKLLASDKPLVISMSDLAASGGYFISMTGDPVIAYPNTITGSIGVVYGKPNLHGLYDKIGVTKDLLTRGPYAAIDSDYTSLSDLERQKLHEGIAATYKSFVTKVATARKKTYDQIDPIAQGRVWMGAQAGKNGLVDRLGGIDTAVQLIRERAKLQPQASIDLVSYPPRRSLVEMVLSGNPDAIAEAAVTKNLQKVLGEMPSPALLRGGILAIMPYRISIR